MLYRIPSLQSELLSLSKSIFDDRDETAQQLPELDAVISVRTLIHQAIASKLPQYFDSNGSRRSDEDIWQYHDELRWNIGSEWLKKNFTQD